jgi:hypothetical protein
MLTQIHCVKKQAKHLYLFRIHTHFSQAIEASQSVVILYQDSKNTFDWDLFSSFPLDSLFSSLSFIIYRRTSLVSSSSYKQVIL